MYIYTDKVDFVGACLLLWHHFLSTKLRMTFRNEDTNWWSFESRIRYICFQKKLKNSHRAATILCSATWRVKHHTVISLNANIKNTQSNAELICSLHKCLQWGYIWSTIHNLSVMSLQLSCPNFACCVCWVSTSLTQLLQYITLWTPHTADCPQHCLYKQVEWMSSFNVEKNIFICDAVILDYTAQTHQTETQHTSQTSEVSHWHQEHSEWCFRRHSFTQQPADTHQQLIRHTDIGFTL